MKICITGSSGFIGSHLVRYFTEKLNTVIPIKRVELSTLLEDTKNVTLTLRELEAKVQVADILIHSAGLAHQPTNDNESEYSQVNHLLTIKLARLAAKSGIKKFIFLSSVKAVGAERIEKYTEDSQETPVCIYGRSKLNAERDLFKLSESDQINGMQIIVLRLPLVYGPGVKANFLSLLKLVNSNLPLPFLGITNVRSYLYVGNLCHLLNEIALGYTSNIGLYFVSDDYDLSTSELVQLQKSALGSASFLFALPEFMWIALNKIAIFKGIITRAVGSFTISCDLIKRDLSWSPPYSIQFGINECTIYFKNQLRLSKYANRKRVLDILAVGLLLILLVLPLVLIAILVKLSSTGPVLYWSDRVGKNNKIFKMPKFRSMRMDAPVLATHLLKDPEKYITLVGKFLRKTSLDELPQLWCIFHGEMSFVGPRPALFNQYDLIQMRTNKEIHQLIPGITGWAQINGRDEIEIEEKVRLDFEYFKNRSLRLDLQIIFMTIYKVLFAAGVKH